jgi:uncharacterized protein (TIGR00290 family)
MTQKIFLSWSGGKDSALALDRLRKRDDIQIVALLTTITEPYHRISMHGVRKSLLEQQANKLGLPLLKVLIPKDAGEDEYRSLMHQAMLQAKGNGIDGIAFGDIFLEDVREYREERLAEVKMKAFFPLWGGKTAEIASCFAQEGFQAIVTCIDSRCLGKEFAGQLIDHRFLEELPSDVDPCGENGEFHSFVFHGPLFRQEVPFRRGRIILRDSFYFCDLLPYKNIDGSPPL